MSQEKPKYTLDFEKPLESLEEQLEQLRMSAQEGSVDVQEEIKNIEKKIGVIKREIFSNLTPWQKVQLSRHPERPHSLDYIQHIFDSFEELHGDRCFKDDGATVGGIAFLEGEPLMVIAQQKGRTTKEKLKRNFGSPNPEGYRKALRLMKMAERFNLPILSIIDTPGAYPGIGAEERHVAQAIAVNIQEMSQLKTPILAVIVGEGGSGGALGIGVADYVLIFENAYYSVISPEGCAAILWKDRAYAPNAASALKMTAENLLKLKIVDEIIPEPLGGAHRDLTITFENFKKAIQKYFKKLKNIPLAELINQRYDRYRSIGEFEEAIFEQGPINSEVVLEKAATN